MSTKLQTLEMMSNAALSALPSVAARAKAAAEESLAAARKTRAKIRRERMTSQSQQLAAVTQVVQVPYEEPPIEMPMEWRDDEDTKKIFVEKP